MNRLFSAKTLAVAAVALGAVGAASAAHARDNVTLSIGFNATPYGYGYVEPAPVYVQPQSVYVQPQPVYVQPRPVYVQPAPVYYNGYYNRGYYEREWHRHHGWDHRRGPWGDADRDGVPNRYDRQPGNPYRY